MLSGQGWGGHQGQEKAAAAPGEQGGGVGE